MTTDWETAVVNNDGTKFAFLDSGEAEGKPEAYTTIVCVHGHSFHARELGLVHLNMNFIGDTP